MKKVCDAACGFGAHTLALASNGFEVSAFDISKTAVELTSLALNKYGHRNVNLKIASITDTGYPDITFDAVTAYAVIDHLTAEDSQKALSELMRIIKPEGLLLLSFDKPDEEDYQCAHDLLPDGTMLYTEDSSREGMLYHPYDIEKIASLTNAYPTIQQWTDCKDSQFVILQKK